MYLSGFIADDIVCICAPVFVNLGLHFFHVGTLHKVEDCMFVPGVIYQNFMDRYHV